MFTFDNAGFAPLITTLCEKLTRMISADNEQSVADIQGYLYSMETLIKENKQEAFFTKRPLLQGEHLLLTLLFSFDETVHIPTLFKTYMQERAMLIKRSEQV